MYYKLLKLIFMKKIIILCFTFFTIQASAQTLINHKGNDIFFSGINLAWMQFGNDLVGFNETTFTNIMKDVSSAGGNSVRWWIHVDGKSTPTYTLDTVTGISALGLNNLEKALDIAAEHGIAVSLCLWSFDMMAKQKTGESEATALARTTKNRILLEDSAATQAYIDNALIPMVTRLAGHTAILCWEIFNEPEGMTTIANWSHVETVNIQYIQRFINRCAGAIHRTDPTAKVSNGSWNARAMCDLPNISFANNYYTDEELFNAGGDADGYLDFYMLHYYAQYYGNSYSPFHNPVSYWQLDKPLIIGEYACHGIIDTGVGFAPTSELNPTEALSYLYDNGYAGGWGWTYTGHDGNGDLDDLRYVMDSLKTAHPEHIIIPRDPNHNYAPTILAQISDTILFVNSDTLKNYINLNHYFIDELQLQYSITPNGPAEIIFENDSIISITAIPDSTGISLFTLKATDNGGKSVTTYFNIVVRDSTVISNNKLLYAFANTSSEEDTINRNPFINDGDLTTRWSSVYNDNEWVEFDMFDVQTISRIKLYWEAAYGDKYEILVSTDKINWDTIYENGQGQTALNNIVFEPIQCRYVRVHFIKRATGWGYSLYEIEAYEDNGASENTAPTASTSPYTLSFNAYYDLQWIFPRTKFTDANKDVLQLSATMQNGDPLPSWIEFDTLTYEFRAIAQLSDTGQYVIRVTATDWFGESAYYDFTMRVTNPYSSIQSINNKTVKLFPNPNKGSICNFTISETTVNTAQIKITNCLGKICMNSTVDCIQGKGDFSIENIPSGIYFITILTKNNSYNQVLQID